MASLICWVLKSQTFTDSLISQVQHFVTCFTVHPFLTLGSYEHTQGDAMRKNEWTKQPYELVIIFRQD